jgi:arylsulfatase A-like enzyme
VFPDLLKEQGYTNIMVGKTHFGPLPESFDVAHIATEKSNDADDAYGKYIRGKGYPRATKHPNPVPEELFMEAFLADTTIQEIERVVEAKQGPFFAYCSMVSPHDPVDPPGRWATLFDDIELPPVRYAEGETERFPEHLKRMLGLLPGMKAGKVYAEEEREAADRHRKLYYGLAAYCDAQIGRILDYLDSKGLRQDTLVIFSSDHGQQLYDHGFNDKHNYYDESWRIPFIMSMPGTLPSGEKRDFAIWNDIPATILAAAGTSCDSMQGFDLLTPLVHGEPSPRSCAVSTLYKSAGLATKRWKLEYYFEERSGRLYDRQADPHETNDLFNVAEYKDIRNELVMALLNWRSDLTDVSRLIAATGGGGPVARRIALHTQAMKGTDSEIRLQEWVKSIE